MYATDGRAANLSGRRDRAKGEDSDGEASMRSAYLSVAFAAGHFRISPICLAAFATLGGRSLIEYASNEAGRPVQCLHDRP